jgi:hypothetical protein
METANVTLAIGMELYVNPVPVSIIIVQNVVHLDLELILHLQVHL